MRDKLKFQNGFIIQKMYTHQIQPEQPNRRTASTTGQSPSPFMDPPYKPKKTTCLTTFKKILYFTHFILIAIFTTYILIRYKHAREPSFTMFALIVFGYMVFWTIFVNFIFLSINKQNWAVMFDRLFIKFFLMLWPICAVISYVKQSFLNITQVAYFALYMCLVSLMLILYELYGCIFAQHQNPQFIFEPNDLKQSDEVVWGQRKKYNQNLMQKNKVGIDAQI